MMSEHNTAWSDSELEASVTAYFEMLELEINSIPYKKSQISLTYLDGPLSKRSRASFEYRMTGISSVLESLSLPRVKGYLPAKNSSEIIKSKLETIIIEKISKIPLYEHNYVHQAILKLSTTLSKVSPDIITLISTVANNILKRPDYQKLLQHLNTATENEISTIASALNEFGLSEISHIAKHAKGRLEVLDQLEMLSKNNYTSEATMHKSIENNLWILGPNYTLFSSNKTLKKQIEEHLSKKYEGTSPNSRPDLILNENLNGEFLIIEFKRPAHALNLEDYLQAISYRHMLGKQLNSTISILIIGGSRAPSFPIENREHGVITMIYREIISSARRQTTWQLQQI